MIPSSAHSCKNQECVREGLHDQSLTLNLGSVNSLLVGLGGAGALDDDDDADDDDMELGIETCAAGANWYTGCGSGGGGTADAGHWLMAPSTTSQSGVAPEQPWPETISIVSL